MMPRQLTHAAYGHVLTNINSWSPDGHWLVYDVRTGNESTGPRIEQINVETGKVRCLYKAENGAACGVATFSPTEPKVVFILGPENPSPDWTYGFSRRHGVIVDTRQPGVARPLDAMNYAPPFVPGALRGGSHVHVFSPDGRWVSFTYEDDVLARLDASSNPPSHDLNQRNVGVAVPAGPVRLRRNHPRNNDGDYFSVVVTRTVAYPQPGSDEICRAFEEGWVGSDGYVRADGSRQRRALAFQGLVTARDGRQHAEVFIVDLPDDLTVPGDGPLGGTITRRPAPPRGTVQRRLTFTDDRRAPRVAAAPRHWLRSSPDGSLIAFLMQDDQGIVQLYTVPPVGGEPRQLTRSRWSVSSAFTWSPDGRWVTYAMDNSIFMTDAATGASFRLTKRSGDNQGPLPQACVFSPDGSRIAFMQGTDSPHGRFSQIFVIEVPFPI